MIEKIKDSFLSDAIDYLTTNKMITAIIIFTIYILSKSGVNDQTLESKIKTFKKNKVTKK